MAGSYKKPPQGPIKSAGAYAAPIIEYSCTVTLRQELDTMDVHAREDGFNTAADKICTH